jgi:hypothetical protein
MCPRLPRPTKYQALGTIGKPTSLDEARIFSCASMWPLTAMGYLEQEYRSRPPVRVGDCAATDQHSSLARVTAVRTASRMTVTGGEPIMRDPSR